LNALLFHNTYCCCVHSVKCLKQLACIFCILQVHQEELFFSCLHLVIVGQTSEEICPGACKIQHIIVHNLAVKQNSKLQQKIPDTMSSTSTMATLEQFPSVLKSPHPISSPRTHYSQSSNLQPTEMYKKMVFLHRDLCDKPRLAPRHIFNNCCHTLRAVAYITG
jgi:hypothetical protein